MMDSGAVFMSAPNGHGNDATHDNKPAMPVSPYPTFPRKREKGQTNRYASFVKTTNWY